MINAAAERSASMAERSELIRRLLAEKLSSQGLFAFGFLPRASFLDVLEKTGTSSAAMSKYDVEKTESVVAVALRYGEGNFSLPAWAERSIEESGGGGSPPPASRVPMMGIGHFARANWYMELSRRMMGAVAGAIQDAANMGLSLPPPKAWRRLVNSGLPEKPLAARAGLGWIGKNGILIADSRHKAGEMDHDEMLSSALVLGLILCPIDIGGEAGEPMREGCGDCCRCIKACPTGALGKSPSGYERSLCIQHWTALDGLPPDEVRTAWGDRLYGCDTCLEACPYFKTDPSATTDIGLIGPELPAKYFLSTEEATIRRDLSGTALDRAWMSIKAFKRNARAASGLEPAC